MHKNNPFFIFLKDNRWDNEFYQTITNNYKQFIF